MKRLAVVIVSIFVIGPPLAWLIDAAYPYPWRLLVSLVAGIALGILGIYYWKYHD